MRFVAVVAILACSPGDEPSIAFVATDSAGVRIATNDIPVAQLPVVITSDSGRFVRIGELAGEQPYMFHRIVDVTRLKSGHIAVVDATQEIRIFDSTGKHVATHGGKGQGPGQFNSVSDLIPQQGDTLVAWDNQAMRYATFTALGGYVDRAASRRKNLSDLLVKDFFWEHMYPVSDGSLIVDVTVRMNYREREEQRPSGQWTRLPGTLVWVDSGFKSYRKLGPRGGIQQIRVNVGGAPQYFVSPGMILPSESVAGNPPRVCVDGLAGPQVDCYDSDGKTLFIRWRTAAPQVTQAELEHWKEVEATASGSRSSPAQVRAALANVPHPGDRTHVITLNVDALRMVWVRSPDLRSDSTVGGARFRVFDSGGQLIGLAVVRGADVREIGEDYLVGVRRDADGVEHVVFEGIRRTNPLGR